MTRFAFRGSVLLRVLLLCGAVALALGGCAQDNGFATPAMEPYEPDVDLGAGAAADIVADPNSVFAGDQATADCFAAEVLDSIGEDRLIELGFGGDGIPAIVGTYEDLVPWRIEEIDNIIEGLKSCVDMVAGTRRFVARQATAYEEWTEADVECVLVLLPKDFELESLRVEFYSLIGREHADTDAAFAAWGRALESCGLPE